MNVEELIQILQKQDPKAVVVIAGFESHNTADVAEVNAVRPCETLRFEPDPIYGNRGVMKEGQPSVWLGWSDDYRGCGVDDVGFVSRSDTRTLSARD